jgi:hypothetical protein
MDGNDDVQVIDGKESKRRQVVKRPVAADAEQKGAKKQKKAEAPVTPSDKDLYPHPKAVAPTSKVKAAKCWDHFLLYRPTDGGHAYCRVLVGTEEKKRPCNHVYSYSGVRTSSANAVSLALISFTQLVDRELEWAPAECTRDQRQRAA